MVDSRNEQTKLELKMSADSSNVSYIVYGDYGYVTEDELYETSNLKAAINWAERYVDKHGMCGYEMIEVIWHTVGDGEHICEWKMTEDDYYAHS